MECLIFLFERYISLHQLVIFVHYYVLSFLDLLIELSLDRKLFKIWIDSTDRFSRYIIVGLFQLFYFLL